MTLTEAACTTIAELAWAKIKTDSPSVAERVSPDLIPLTAEALDLVAALLATASSVDLESELELVFFDLLDFFDLDFVLIWIETVIPEISPTTSVRFLRSLALRASFVPEITDSGPPFELF